VDLPGCPSGTQKAREVDQQNKYDQVGRNLKHDDVPRRFNAVVE
jgi:hypothetical protein